MSYLQVDFYDQPCKDQSTWKRVAAAAAAAEAKKNQSPQSLARQH